MSHKEYSIQGDELSEFQRKVMNTPLLNVFYFFFTKGGKLGTIF